MKKALILAGIYWNDPLQRHQQFAMYLKKNGFQVYFVEHIVSTRFTVSKFLHVLNGRKKVKCHAENNKIIGIEVLNMHFVTPGNVIFNCINKQRTNKLLNQIGNEFDIVINYLPINTTRYIVQNIKYSKLIYDCVRNFEEWGEYGKDIICEEDMLLERCEKVFTDSYYLTNKMKSKFVGDVVQFLPIADIAWRKGCSKKKSVFTIKNIAYFGTLDKHINIKTFERLVQEGCTLHIWGRVALELDFPYVNHGYFKNLKELAEDIMQCADAFVLPYQGNMNGVIPAKMMQCLQTELPIYISHFYDSEQLSKYVYLYEDTDDLCNQIVNYNDVTHKKKVDHIKCLMEKLDDEHQYERFCQELL